MFRVFPGIRDEAQSWRNFGRDLSQEMQMQISLAIRTVLPPAMQALRSKFQTLPGIRRIVALSFLAGAGIQGILEYTAPEFGTLPLRFLLGMFSVFLGAGASSWVIFWLQTKRLPGVPGFSWKNCTALSVLPALLCVFAGFSGFPGIIFLGLGFLFGAVSSMDRETGEVWNVFLVLLMVLGILGSPFSGVVEGLWMAGFGACLGLAIAGLQRFVRGYGMRLGLADVAVLALCGAWMELPGVLYGVGGLILGILGTRISAHFLDSGVRERWNLHWPAVPFALAGLLAGMLGELVFPGVSGGFEKEFLGFFEFFGSFFQAI